MNFAPAYHRYHKDCRKFIRTISLVFVSIFFLQLSLGQSPYRTRWDKEMLYTGTGIVTFGTGAYLRNKITLFTPEELEHLDQFFVNPTDRQATQMLSGHSDRASDYFMNSAQALPLLFLAGKDTRHHFGQIALMYGETMLITTGLTSITKYAVHRPRPFVYNEDASLSSIQTINAQSSFVSGHTSMTAAATFFAAKVYSDFYPDSEWRPIVWTAAAIVPAVTGYLRIRAGKHYPTDVIGGYALGAAVGILVPHLHRTRDNKKRDFSLTAIPNGFYLTMDFW
ncbi:MAG TPA: phosphatase PAP2 family protein [Saprospiraceae bacterium]|nr:phosphatase PAP2 family protein [Saprospiraceae bacterium]